MSIGWPGSWTKKGDVRSESLRCSSLEAPSSVKALRNVTRAGLPHKLKFTRTSTQAHGLHSDSKSLVTPFNIPGDLLVTQKHSQLIASTLAKESVVCHSSASHPESCDSQTQGVLSSSRHSTNDAGAKLELLSSSRLSLQIIDPECHQQRTALKVHLAVHHHFPNHPISCKRRDRVSDNFNNLG